MDTLKLIWILLDIIVLIILFYTLWVALPQYIELAKGCDTKRLCEAGMIKDKVCDVYKSVGNITIPSF